MSSTIVVGKPSAILIAPSGEYVRVANGTSTVAIYGIDKFDGHLTANGYIKSPAPVDSAENDTQ